MTDTSRPKHIAVLMGGWSAEREVSLTSGKAVAKALTELGHRVETVDVAPDIAEVLARVKPDLAFNALHGRFGEDGCIQGILEVLKIPYTHSGVLASALAMDKPMAKRVFASAGLVCAEGQVVAREEMLSGKEPMKRPYVIKPINEGSSVGVAIVQEGDNFHFGASNWPFGDAVLVERYIPGREIHVAVLDDAALGAVEIIPKGRFYDYEAKYTDGFATHLMPAPLTPKAYEEALSLALRAHRALGCRGLSRSDFRYNEEEGQEEKGFFLLETNTQPGMTPLSLSPEIAQHAGISFHELVARLVSGARLGA